MKREIKQVRTVIKRTKEESEERQKMEKEK